MRRARPPAGLLLAVAPLVATVLLVANDTSGKGHWPGFVTGKASDAAGLFLLPVVLIAALEVVRNLKGLPWAYRRRDAAIVCIVVACGFIGVKGAPLGATLYGHVLGIVRWPLSAMINVASGQGLPELAVVDVVADPSDILTLPAVLLAFAFLASRCQNSQDLLPLRHSGQVKSAKTGR